MVQKSNRRGLPARPWSGVRWVPAGIIAMVLVALASYWLPVADAGPGGAASSPAWRYVVQPHIDQADATWSGHGLRLLVTAMIWCLGGTLLAAVRALRAPHDPIDRWQIALSGLSSTLSIWIFVALSRLPEDDPGTLGAVLACIATVAAWLGTMVLATQRSH